MPDPRPPHHRPDLTETSPMDSKATADAERAARAIENGAAPHGPHARELAPEQAGASSPAAPASSANPPSGIHSRSRSKSGTNIDTIIGRIVVDQGLATNEEVQQCIEQVRSSVDEGNQKSLSHLLVRNEYITSRQLDRIRAQAEAERSGQQIPGYKILGKLGQGAMATVFKARQLSLDRLVAIKVLPRKFSENRQFIERFYAEGRAAAQLNHPNIVQAFDVGQAGEFHFFVMEFVEGRTVYDDIVKHKRFEEKEAIEVVSQIAEALQHAHSKGLIHRDVKPKNIMINREGIAKLADMGLARAISDKEAAEAEQGKAFGTPYYISPEQIRGELNIGPQTDIYSLGATLYHMVTGSVPFDGKNPSAVMHKHLKAELVAPDHVNARLSPGISEVIEMMMAKSPRDRYRSCADLLGDLRAVRDKKDPPIAHKDLAALDMASLAKAEAAAPAAMVEDHSQAASPMVSRSLFMTLLVVLAISVVVNVILLALRAA